MPAISKLKIRNFKGFPNEESTIDFEEKNVLLYGENGSGKSSIYWALYTLLQASTKSTTEIAKYFTPNNSENLINLHFLKSHPSFSLDVNGEIEEPQSIGQNAYVEAYFSDGRMEKIDVSGLSGTSPSGFRDLTFTENLNRHSDFIANRLLINFYNYRNSKEINLWQVFVRDIFPFLFNNAGSGIRTLSQDLKEINSTKPFKLYPNNTFTLSKSSNWQNRYNNSINDFNQDVNYWLGEINTYVNDFYQTHFEPLYNDGIRISLDYKQPLVFSKVRPQFYHYGGNDYERWYNLTDLNEPVISLKIESLNNDGSYTVISRPQSYLNEAKLTSIALAIRFSLLHTNIRPNFDGQFLALDDLLISLDMSNRDKVMDIILNEYANRFKVYLFTHEKSFYDFCLYKIQQHSQTNNWSIQEIYEPQAIGEKPVIINSEYTNYDKAKKYFKSKDYVATSLYLRKEFEKVVKDRLPEEYTKTVEGEFHNLAHYWKLFREHFKALSIDMDSVSPTMNKDFEQSKAFILNRQAHHNLSEPVYTIELKKVFTLIDDIKRLFPIPDSTIILSKGIDLTFKHPTLNYTFEFKIDSDFSLNSLSTTNHIVLPQCKVVTWQMNNIPYLGLDSNKIVAYDITNPIREKIIKIINRHVFILNLGLSINIFLENTFINESNLTLQELLNAYDIQFYYDFISNKISYRKL
ncbi:AAA family ATPase [Tenacibaculum sp. IB213877]|uniref:AAA family ATPase n=1 Tax=Tenacibaculum sp. IB213877 TaxID=3097351 RepID=UPI002A5AE41F|nr:AAA family ATPase [Tenacibaculum sp. IB213877]MDY0779965.1 AAA family ATPase [Tenacibaculum sp. IB213877]